MQKYMEQKVKQPFRKSRKGNDHGSCAQLKTPLSKNMCTNNNNGNNVHYKDRFDVRDSTQKKKSGRSSRKSSPNGRNESSPKGSNRVKPATLPENAKSVKKDSSVNNKRRNSYNSSDNGSSSSSSASESSGLYAGPTFLHSPAASKLPIPDFLNDAGAVSQVGAVPAFTTVTTPEKPMWNLFPTQACGYRSMPPTPTECGSQEIYFGATQQSAYDGFFEVKSQPCNPPSPLANMHTPIHSEAVKGKHSHSTTTLELLFHRDREQRLFRLLRQGSA
ncbi:hypothetical protein SJAG_01746 [Schizosaccharomyces japonicus yFS275]|uniref:Uncharacterized protein n=1 Tax=Schizosaccharomyces japonicus (strain yFS275 / FY16936) TaxID=402676 RepID=B6JYS8_SCHJY|nr:hypothetical protein SJAG_01746 [Schizosaccharomyces japonicus yFS275]EEB06696.1 hypothetical protein SJAG_01746 [Schizosaccharomyces japonicus yFS275]